MATRRLPDTYNREVVRTSRPRGSLGSVSTVQFEFLFGARDDEVRGRKNQARVDDPQKEAPRR